MLWREHLFLVEQDFSSGSIGRGIAAAEFAAADLDAHGLSIRTG